MRKFTVMLFCLFLAGCTTTTQNVSKQSRPKRNLTQFDQVKLGMTMQQVQEIMGGKIIIGYEKNEKAPQGLEPIVLENPTRSEKLRSNNKTYDVLYYYIRVQKADGVVANDEMIPFVFDGDNLAGKTWDYLFKLRDRN